MRNLLQSLPFPIPETAPLFDNKFRDALMHRDGLAESVLPAIAGASDLEPGQIASVAYQIADEMMRRNRYAVEREIRERETQPATTQI